MWVAEVSGISLDYIRSVSSAFFDFCFQTSDPIFVFCCLHRRFKNYFWRLLSVFWHASDHNIWKRNCAFQDSGPLKWGPVARASIAPFDTDSAHLGVCKMIIKEEGNWSWNFHYKKKVYRHLDSLNLCCSSVCGAFFGWFKHVLMFRDRSFFWGSFGLMSAWQPCSGRRVSSHGKRSARHLQGWVWLALVSPARSQQGLLAQVVCWRVLWLRIWRAAFRCIW